jgi:hypothetical protein
MNSKERQDKRFERRKAKRQAKHLEKSKECGDFNQVFSYENLFRSAALCSNGVRWKSSTQNYNSKLPINTFKTYQALQNNTYKSKGFHHFTIMERGKKRKIKSVHISERVVQKTLCDKVLVPLHTNGLIYDNGASQKGKGMDFSLNRLSTHLRRHFKHHGTNGYALLFDFKNYFGDAPHEPIYRENDKLLHDPRIRKLANQFMEDFGKVGLGLGSQVSQTYALTIPNAIDHFIKEKLGIKGYGRYMDDAYALHYDKEHLKHCMAKIKEKCGEIGLALNEKKSRIVSIAKGFKFLKTKFTLSETGKVFRKMNPESTKRMRKKLKTFKRWLAEGKITMPDVKTAYDSYKGHLKRGDSYRKLKRMDEFYYSLFGRY